jgi:xanthine dehydrogenase accessory factor
MNGETWNVPESTVLADLLEHVDSGLDAVLVTVTDVTGNAYRRPGAKMLVPDDGSEVGNITAGCLEDEVRALAAEVVTSGQSRTETFDLMEDDDVWGLGVGCNGIIDILLEPIGEGHTPMTRTDDAGPVAAVLVLDDADHVSQFQRYHYRTADDAFVEDEVPAWLADGVREPARRLAERGKADTIEVEGPREPVDVFVDGIAPPSRLVVLGTGGDVRPVLELGNRCGFRTTLVGFRGADATAERFPAADQVVSTSPADVREAVDFDGDTYVVVMTHNFVDDRLALGELRETPVPYIGLLGPRDRFEQMRDRFDEADATLSSADLDRIYTPAGLDLGGGSPHQIALSILAEVEAVRNDRRPRHLTEREGPIHERVDADPTTD